MHLCCDESEKRNRLLASELAPFVKSGDCVGTRPVNLLGQPGFNRRGFPRRALRGSSVEISLSREAFWSGAEHLAVDCIVCPQPALGSRESSEQELWNVMLQSWSRLLHRGNLKPQASEGRA